MNFTKSFVVLSVVASSLLAGSYYDKGQLVELQPLSETRTIDGNTVHYFQDVRNQKVVGVDQEIIVKLADAATLEQITGTYDLKVKKSLQAGMWLLEVFTGDSLEICKELYEAGLVLFAHPDFYKETSSRATVPSDPYFEYAWHFVDTDEIEGASINLLEAWDYTKGSGVTIAVFDDAVDTAHEDLSAAVVSSYNVQTGGNDASPVSESDSHGTFVAGVAIAQENGVGTVGVAPEAKLIAINNSDTAQDSEVVAAFNYAKENADVMNNSWGTYQIGEATRTAIINAANNGRDGKGMIITFGAGNDACQQGNLCYEDGDMSGGVQGYIKDDESFIDEVLAVGAMNHLNQRASYSNWGEYLDISAPGGDGDDIDVDSAVGMVSLHLNNSYTDGTDINEVGTSYSAPVVAGVAALIISANPDLTRQEIFDILRDTADQVGGYNYDSTTKKSAELGWGRVNAAKAVARAVEMKGDSDSSSSESSSSSASTDGYHDFSMMSSGWHLLGAVEDMGDIQSENSGTVQTVWTYSPSSGWSKNPGSIEAGKGFWLKR